MTGILTFPVIPGDRRETRDPFLSSSNKGSGMDPGSALRSGRDDSAGKDAIKSPITVALITAGIGLRPGTSEADILACLDQAVAAAGAAEPPVRFATIASRIGEPGLIAAARSRNAQLITIPDEALAGYEAACATRSTRIAGLYGVGSVAEAAALAAAGPGAVLIQPRIATARVTCALARSAP